MKKRTEVNHPPEQVVAADNHALVAPIYQSVKFEFPSVDETQRALRGERAGYFYSRSSNPTTRQLVLPEKHCRPAKNHDRQRPSQQKTTE